MSLYPKNMGFTLIELLVVMMILGITSSLVAPDMFSIVKRSQAKTELEKIKALAELSIERSFFSASRLGIAFKDNTVVFSQLNDAITESNKILKTIESDFFTFEETNVVVNKGHWQGRYFVRLTKSPENKLTTLVLIDDDGTNTKTSIVDTTTSEVDYSDSSVKADLTHNIEDNKA